MAWNEPGGDKPRDPWGPGKDPQPPDLDEALRRFKQRLSGLFGGSGGSGGTDSGRSPVNAGPIMFLVVLLLGVWLVFDSIHIIDERERGVVLRFGKSHRELGPGLQFAFPRPIERVFKVDVAQVRSTEAQVRMLTLDENIIHINFGVQYRVKDARAFLFQVRTPENSLHQAAEGAIRSGVGATSMDVVLGGGRSEVAANARALLQDVLDRYGTGIEVLAVNFQDVRPPAQVKDSFDDAISAREDRQRLENEAEAYASQEIPQARGAAARIVEDATGYRDSLIARSEGEAQRFVLLLTEYARAPEVTRERLYLETMQEVFSRTPKVLLDATGSGNLLYLPIDRLLQQGQQSRSSDDGTGNTRMPSMTTVTPQSSISQDSRTRTSRPSRESR